MVSMLLMMVCFDGVNFYESIVFDLRQKNFARRIWPNCCFFGFLKEREQEVKFRRENLMLEVEHDTCSPNY